jgi:hypothetical protein
VFAVGMAAVLIICGTSEDIYLKINRPIKDYKDVKAEFEAMSENFHMKNYYGKREKKMTDKVNNLDIKEELNSEQVLSLISNYCENNGIKINRVSFEGMDEVIVDGTENAESTYNFHDNILKDGELLPVTVEFNCSYENMLQFIDDIKNNTGNVALTKMCLLCFDDGTVNVVINMNFYSLNTDG